MAEALLNFKGRLNFTPFSAGSHPSGTVRGRSSACIGANSALERASKPWDEFAKPGSPKLDFVFTVSTTRRRKLPGLARAANDCLLEHARSHRWLRQ